MDEREQRAETHLEWVMRVGVPHEDKPWLTAPLPTPEDAAMLRGWLWGDPAADPAAVPAVQSAA